MLKGFSNCVPKKTHETWNLMDRNNSAAESRMELLELCARNWYFQERDSFFIQACNLPKGFQLSLTLANTYITIWTFTFCPLHLFLLYLYKNLIWSVLFTVRATKNRRYIDKLEFIFLRKYVCLVYDKQFLLSGLTYSDRLH